jgi:hypothetical protein
MRNLGNLGVHTTIIVLANVDSGSWTSTVYCLIDKMYIAKASDINFLFKIKYWSFNTLNAFHCEFYSLKFEVEISVIRVCMTMRFHPNLFVLVIIITFCDV